MQPNFILIVADELRADALGCYGNSVCRTPALDALAADGIRFDQAMVTQPTCTPSRASLLTGCYSSALRTRMVGCSTPDDPRFLPKALALAGYRTASIGKIHFVPQAREAERVQAALASDGHYFGFTDVDLVNGHGDRCFGPAYDRFVAEIAPDADERRRQRRDLVPPFAHKSIGPYTYELPAEAHSTNYVAERAVAFLCAAAGRMGGAPAGEGPLDAATPAPGRRELGWGRRARAVEGPARDAPAGGDSRDERPFFLHVSFPDPHHPFTVPEPWASMYDPREMPAPVAHQGSDSRMPPWYEAVFHGETSPRVPGRRTDRITGTVPADYSAVPPETWAQIKATYYGMTSLLDDGVGRILSALGETGLDATTHVIFVSDHGEYLGDHGFVGKGFHFDSVLRVPLIWRPAGGRSDAPAPMAFKPGTVQSGVASLVDVAPTILELAGVAELEGLQGVSMAEALAGGEPPRAAALTENDDDLHPVRMRTVTTAEWKLTRYANEAWGELYDRSGDPAETRNLYGVPAYAAVQAELTELLLEELLCSFDSVNGRTQEPAPGTVKWVPRRRSEAG